MINFHGGVKFNEYSVENKNGIYLLDITEKAIPQPILLNNEVVDYSEDILIITIGIRDYRESRSNTVQDVLRAVMNATKVQFKDENYYRQVLAVENIDRAYQEPFLQLDVTIRCKPYKYVDEPKKALGANIINDGNHTAHTLLEVTGNATVNGMTIAGAPSTVYINSEDKTAYTLSSGKQINALPYVTGDTFLELKPGSNTITFLGNVQITYKHTYLY